MMKAERLREILQILGGDGAATVSELARRFSTSTMTIRRDLIELQRQGLLNRTHGGAMLDASIDGYARYESGSFEDRTRTQARQKRAIAERAAQLVSDGDSLLINAGSTMTAFATALRQHRQLHVVTNGLTVAVELAKNPTTGIFVLPGLLERKKMSTVLQNDPHALDDIRPSSAFLGVVGVAVDQGPMMADPAEAATNRAFVSIAEEVTLLVDSSKFAAQATYRIAPMARIARIITDSGIAEADRDALTAQGVDVIVVDPASGTAEA